jgi:hypothetical protein
VRVTDDQSSVMRFAKMRLQWPLIGDVFIENVSLMTRHRWHILAKRVTDDEWKNKK